MTTRNEAIKAAYDNAIEFPDSARLYLDIANHLANYGDTSESTGTVITVVSVNGPHLTAEEVQRRLSD